MAIPLGFLIAQLGMRAVPVMLRTGRIAMRYILDNPAAKEKITSGLARKILTRDTGKYVDDVAKLKQKSTGDLNRYLLTPEQELVEAVALLSIIEGKQIPSYKSIKVSGESYILGLLDCIGELKRQIIDQIRIGNSKNAENYFEIMENLYLILYPFA